MTQKGFSPLKKYYGVPRGGQYLAAMLNPVDTPEQADIIIDDLIDSGKTRDRYLALYPGKPFVALFDKTTEPEVAGVWLRFPWEKTGMEELEDNAARIIQYFDDSNRPGLVDTPRRYVKFLKEFLNPPEFNFTTFDSEGADEMIVVSNIPFFSLCEHHLAPFFGTAAIGYIPNETTIAGISKLPRVLEMFARRFQNQERITTQVAEYLNEKLSPRGVAVTITARHLCMEMRGVKKHDTWTTTSKLIGVFKEDPDARREFLNLSLAE
jgi:GTP cyclohydrolase I